MNKTLLFAFFLTINRKEIEMKNSIFMEKRRIKHSIYDSRQLDFTTQ
jgi:hypothetical protein